MPLATAFLGQHRPATQVQWVQPDELPVPAITVTASNLLALQGHILIHDGTFWKRIILEDGIYAGLLNVNKARIQICSRNLNGAVFTKAVTLSGAESLVSRCKSTGGFICSGAGTHVNRCQIQGTGTGKPDIVGVNIAAGDVQVDGNEFTKTGNGILVQDALRPVTRRNWLHDQGTPPTDRNAWIYVGESRNTSLISQQCRIEYNRLESSKQHQHIELKSRDNRVIGNTSVQGRTIANVYSRHGPANYFALNWMIGSSSVIGAADTGTVMIMNHGRAAIRGGEISGDQLRAGAKGIVYAEDTIVALHDGPIELGWNQGVGLVAPQRTMIEDSYGPISQDLPSLYTTRPLTLAPPDGILRELRAPNDVGQIWS